MLKLDKSAVLHAVIASERGMLLVSPSRG